MKLIADWRRAGRLYSVRVMIFGGIVDMAAFAWSYLEGYLPISPFLYLGVSLALKFLALVVRLISQSSRKKMASAKQVNDVLTASLRRRKAPAWMLALAVFVGAGEGVRQYVYTDPVGIPTVCFGETGKHVRLGQPARSLEECADLMLDRLEALDKRLDQLVKVPLTPGEKIAYSSFIYNMGEGKTDVKDGFVWLKARDSRGRPRHSTLFLKLNAGDHIGACNQLQYWNNPKWLRGLTIRRAEEKVFCLKDIAPANDPAFEVRAHAR